MVAKKHEIEAALYAEHQEISAGRLKDDNPLDSSEDFRLLCEACRRGDLKVCQEKITAGVNINARDRFDYTPLILASLCGHFEVVQLLLESGALCERDTFQGERCLYNALNDKIRNLLLSYDYSKSTDPLQPLAAHITSLLTRQHPKTSDIIISTHDSSFEVHKFLLAARSPYFAKKLAIESGASVLGLSNSIASQSVGAAMKYLYLSGVNLDFAEGEEEKIILEGIEKIGRKLEIESLFDSIMEGNDRRLARQRRTDELTRGRDQLEEWFLDHVVKYKINVETDKADLVLWDRKNAIFADVLLRADEEEHLDDGPGADGLRPSSPSGQISEQVNSIPIGPLSQSQRSPSTHRRPRRSILFPTHRAMLLRSEYFLAMFSSTFREAQETEHLQIIPVACSPEVLEVVLRFIYTERAEFPLEMAIDVLFAGDLLFLETLKTKAATIISTLGNGTASVVESESPRGGTGVEESIDIYDVVRAGWDTRVPRLEEFGARYIASRLERYIDQPEFAQLVSESATRIQQRQETDTIELIDDIRYYLSERFRLRFEDAGLDEMMDEAEKLSIDEPFEVSNGHISFNDESKETEKAADGFDISNGKLAAGNPDTSNLFGGATVIRTLDGNIAGDEFTQEAMDYQILLGKIDALLENLKLDA